MNLPNAPAVEPAEDDSEDRWDGGNGNTRRGSQPLSETGADAETRVRTVLAPADSSASER